MYEVRALLDRGEVVKGRSFDDLDAAVENAQGLYDYFAGAMDVWVWNLNGHTEWKNGRDYA